VCGSAILRYFQHCDFLLVPLERAAWRRVLSDDGCKNVPGADQNSIFASVERIAEEGVARAIQAHVLGRVGSGSLTLFRARLYHTLLSAPSFSAPELAADGEKINDVADRIRSGGVQYLVLLVLLTRAWLRFLSGARTGPESAQADLDEAWENRRARPEALPGRHPPPPRPPLLPRRAVSVGIAAGRSRCRRETHQRVWLSSPGRGTRRRQSRAPVAVTSHVRAAPSHFH
jgi:hypothetical protein